MKPLRELGECRVVGSTWSAEELLDCRTQADVHDRVHALVDWVHNEGDGPQACNSVERTVNSAA